MQAVTDQALVLKVQAYGERDALVQVFARAAGRLTLKITGYKNPKRDWQSIVQSFALLDVEYVPPAQSGGIGRWREASLLALADDICLESYVLLETLQNILKSDQQMNKSVWQLAETLLSAGSVTPKDVTIVLLKILTDLGFLPDLSQCTQSQAKLASENPATWLATGEMVAGQLSSAGLALSFPELKTVCFWQRESFAHAQKVTAPDAFVQRSLRHLVQIVEQILDRPLKSKEMLD